MKNTPHPLFSLETSPEAPAQPANGFALDKNRFLSLRDKLANAKKGRPPKFMIRASNADDIVRQIPARGERLHATLRGDCTLCDVVSGIIQKFGPGAICHMATLSMNEKNAAQLAQLLASGQIASLNLLWSSYFSETSKSDVAPACRSLLSAATIGIARCHAKTYVLNCGIDSFVVETSANLRSSGNVEQATFFNDADLAQFHAAWISELIQKSNL